MTDSRRSRTALNTVKVVGLMAILKGASWLFTDSSGVLGSAADSFVDVLTTLLVLWAVLHAEQPADADHPWGHGKAEGLAALFQSLFITLAGCGVIFESIHQTMDGESQVENHWLGIGVMFLCSIITLWWARYVGRVAKETGSIALEADRQHHMTDVLVNVAAMAGLGLSAMLDSQTWPDSMVGLVIGLVILNTARGVFLEGVGNLMDRGIQASEE
ncbi:MAG: cation diffusion facilitator family transporter, partial [Planctomycetes bacterium]|nr:cation diffusion facilitator family transporter [Planctomycetota bacterium]